jgi:hypothetical protein
MDTPQEVTRVAILDKHRQPPINLQDQPHTLLHPNSITSNTHKPREASSQLMPVKPLNTNNNPHMAPHHRDNNLLMEDLPKANTSNHMPNRRHMGSSHNKHPSTTTTVHHRVASHHLPIMEEHRRILETCRRPNMAISKLSITPLTKVDYLDIRAVHLLLLWVLTPTTTTLQVVMVHLVATVEITNRDGGKLLFVVI